MIRPSQMKRRRGGCRVIRLQSSPSKSRLDQENASWKRILIATGSIVVRASCLSSTLRVARRAPLYRFAQLVIRPGVFSELFEKHCKHTADPEVEVVINTSACCSQRTLRAVSRGGSHTQHPYRLVCALIRNKLASRVTRNMLRLLHN